MRIPSRHTIVLGSVLSLILLSLVVIAVAGELVRREITRTTEKQLSVNVDASFGTIYVGKGPSNKIVVAEYWKSDGDKQKLDMTYKISNDEGDLSIDLNEVKRKSRNRSDDPQWKEYSADDRNWDDRKWSVQLTNELPMDLRVGLGAGKGEFDLSGLQIKSLRISSGASSAELRCETPNKILAESVVIESGVSKFEATDLCNVNFRKLKFSGGVGAYKLDFGGKLRQSADASIEVGLGAISISIPHTTPTRILYDDTWFSHMDIDDSYSKVRSGVYESDSYQKADKRLLLRIASGLGSIRIRSR